MKFFTESPLGAENATSARTETIQTVCSCPEKLNYHGEGVRGEAGARDEELPASITGPGHFLSASI